MVADSSQDLSHRRRWRRFSVRSLWVLITLLCIVLGLHMHRVRTQQDAISKLNELGVAASQLDYDQSFARTRSKATPSWKQWLVEQLGHDHFAHVVRVRMRATDETNGPFSSIVDQLARLPHLREVRLFDVGTALGRLGAEDFREIARLNQVERIDIDHGTVTAAMIEPLAEMQNLRHLHMTWTDPTPDDEAFEAMAQITSLRIVEVPSYTEAQQQALARVRPDVSLEMHQNYGD